MIDLSEKPRLEALKGMNEQGKVLSLKKIGKCDEKNDVYGWNFRYGTTGMVSLGDGYYYFSQNWEKDDWFGTKICLYRWDGENPFALVEED